MDESRVHDVVKQQSEGDASLPDDIATSYSSSTAKGEVPALSNSNATNSQPHTEAGDQPYVPTLPLTNHTSLDGGPDSDSDTVNQQTADAVDSQGEGKGHNRTYSVKKPAAFKAVSVTKTFLAKAAGIPLGAKAGEKLNSSGPTGSTSQVAQRPRLVAKSGSGLREAIPQSVNGSKGPDGKPQSDVGKVWNKNRPPQPSAPKQFTDEELKQQYGIHLATRLQTDEGKEAKWADIDDDDEDWAPETIEWNDGTKITLQAHEEPPPVFISPQIVPSASMEADQAKVEDQKQFGSRQTFTKPSPADRSRPGSLVLKGAAEKATLVAKPPGPPTPVKSPWAQLPPVDKVPPISIHPQGYQPPQSRFQQRDMHNFEGLAQAPAKEIAADDFNRSWRDNQSFSNRELYNSQSGRYEPVSENRRGSVRTEQHFRQPSVLQRPSPTDSKNPAEPSAAFQTSRSGGGTENTWGRRRASSNLSGGSGNMGRRMSIGKPHDLPQGMTESQMLQRRGSQAIVESPGPSRDHSPAMPNQQHARGQSLQQGLPGPPRQRGRQPTDLNQDPLSNQQVNGSAILTQENSSSNISNEAGEKGSENTDPVVMQGEIMRQAREQARQRRKELEEKEEAAKKERIKLKLESLDLPSQEMKKEASPESVAPVLQSTETLDKAQSPPKPPIPETSGEIRQYGMMKLHHPETVRHRNGAQPHAHGVDSSSGHTRRANSSSRVPMDSARGNKENTSIIANGVPHMSLPASELSTTRDHKVSSVGDSKQDQSWKSATSGPDNFMAWANSGMTTHSTPGGNLWGPPTNDKALGNGTFDSGFGRVSGSSNNPSQQLSPSMPGPIGPSGTSPHLSNSTINSLPSNHQEMRSDPAFHGRSAQQQSAFRDSVPIMDQRGLQNAMQLSRPGPIAPPGSSTASRPGKAQAVSAWGNFANSVQQKEAEEGAEARRRQLLQRDEELRTGNKPEVPPVKETWRAVNEKEAGLGQRSLIGITQTTGPMRSTRELQSNAGQHQQYGNHRGSRFFPHNVEHSQHFTNLSTGERSDSPPPPETNDHPAADGDRQHPHVSLPIPKPRVRLPPIEQASGSQEAAEPSSPFQPSPERVVATTATVAWQDRFNGLFGRKQSSPPKSYALAVHSTAIPPGYESSSAGKYATVSLPKTPTPRLNGSIFVIDDSSDVTSKANEDELLGEPEFGSLPAIKIPKQAPQNLWHPARAPPALRSKSRFQKQISVVSAESIRLETEGDARGTMITIHLPGTQQKRSVLKPRHAGVNSRHRQTSTQWKDKRKHQKTREPSASHASPQPPKPAQVQAQPAGEQRPPRASPASPSQSAGKKADTSTPILAGGW